MDKTTQLTLSTGFHLDKCSLFHASVCIAFPARQQSNALENPFHFYLFYNALGTLSELCSEGNFAKES